MTIYIAGKYTAKNRLRAERDRIHAEGTGRAVSSWLDEPPTPYGTFDDAHGMEMAGRDIAEVFDADLLILDTRDESTTGGREVEAGFALAAGAQVWRVGPVRNIFHLLLPSFDSWDEVHAALAKEAETGPEVLR